MKKLIFTFGTLLMCSGVFASINEVEVKTSNNVVVSCCTAKAYDEDGNVIGSVRACVDGHQSLSCIEAENRLMKILSLE